MARGLGDKLGLREVFANADSTAGDDNLLENGPN